MFIRAQGRSQNQSFPGRTPSLRAMPRANGDIQLLQLFFGSAACYYFGILGL